MQAAKRNNKRTHQKRSASGQARQEAAVQAQTSSNAGVRRQTYMGLDVQTSAWDEKKTDIRLTRVGSGQQRVNVPSHCTKDPPLHKILELFTCDKNRTHRNNSACRSSHSTIFVSVFLSPSPHTVLPSTRTYLALRNITVVAIRIRAVVSYPAAMLLLHVEAVR